MKKILIQLPYFLIIILIITIILMLNTKSIDTKKNVQLNISSANIEKQKTLLGKPVASIEIEPYLISKFCKASTGDVNSTWKYDSSPRMPVTNTNGNNYRCYTNDKSANKNLFEKSADLQNIGYVPETICNYLFNQEFLSGVATDDQYSCTLMSK